MDDITESIENSTPGVLHKSIQGGKWLTIGNLIQKAVSFLSFFVLARLLSPADFGVLAIVLLIPRMVQSSTEPGFGTAAIQREGDITPYLDPIWTIGVLKGIAIAVGVYFAGPYIASYLHVEYALFAVRLGGLFILVQNLSNIGEIFLFKHIDFKQIFIRNTARDLSYTIVAVVIAIFVRSYWALVIATFVSYAIQSVSTYFLQSYRPALSFSFHKLRDLLWYSKWIVGQNWLDQAYGFIEQTAVAHLTNVTDTGLYSKAKSLASVAPGFMNPVISMVSFSAYAKLKNSSEKLRDGFIKSLDVLFFFLIPASIVVIAGGGKLILIVLGTKWLPMINALRVLLVFYLINSINDISSTLLNAIGFPDKEIRFSLLKIIVTALGIVPLTMHFGIVGTAIALLIGIIPTVALNLHYLVALTAVTYRDIFHAGLWPMAISLLCLLPAVLYKNSLLGLSPVPLIAVIGVIGLLYCAAIALVGKRYGRGPFLTIELMLRLL